MGKNENLEDLFGKKTYRVLIQQITEFAIIYLDLQGKILSWNKGAQSILGFTPDEIVGRDFSLIYSPEDRSEGVPQKELEKARKTGQAEDLRWHQRKDGARIFVSGVTNVLKDEKGRIKGFVKVARNDTDHNQAKDALKRPVERNTNIWKALPMLFILLIKNGVSPI